MSVTYNLGTGWNGFSLPYSKNIHSKTSMTIEELDNLFDNKLSMIRSHGGALFKDPNLGWIGNGGNISTHQGFLVKTSEAVEKTLTADYLTSQLGERWYDYEKQDFTGQLSLGWNLVGYPFQTVNSNNNSSNTFNVDVGGRNMKKIIGYGHTGQVTGGSTWLNDTAGWVGSYAPHPGNSAMVHIGMWGTNFNDPPTIKHLFKKYNNNGSGFYMGPIEPVSESETQGPYKWNNNGGQYGIDINHKSIYIKNPDDRISYGVKNIDGVQLLQGKYSGPHVPLSQRPHIWIGHEGHADMVVDIDDNGSGAIAHVKVKENTVNGGASFSATNPQTFAEIIVTNGANHDIPADGGQMVWISGVSGAYADNVNGMREVVRESGHAQNFRIICGGPVNTENSFTPGSDQVVLTSLKWRFCGDGYEGMARGVTGNAEISQMNPDLTWTLDLDGGSGFTYNKDKYDLTCNIKGNQGDDGSSGGYQGVAWTGHNGGIISIPTKTGGSGIGTDPTLSLTAMRFKASTGMPLTYQRGHTVLNVGGFYGIRRSNSNYWFGVGNGDIPKIRVWDPINEGMYAGKFVNQLGNPITLQYYGQTAPGVMDQIAFNSTTGWKDHWEELGGMMLNPTSPVGIRLYQIAQDN